MLRDCFQSLLPCFAALLVPLPAASAAAVEQQTPACNIDAAAACQCFHSLQHPSVPPVCKPPCLQTSYTPLACNALPLQALRLGVSGFSAGLSIGKSLIEEQAGLLNNVLGATASFLGSPYAEMIWCQAVGALFVGMLSELVYTSILGLLGGLAYGEAVQCTVCTSAALSWLSCFAGWQQRAWLWRRQCWGCIPW